MTLLEMTRIHRTEMRMARGWTAAALALAGTQTLLSALFLFAGGMKLVLPADALVAGTPFAAWFMQAIGVLEVLGALGLVAPAISRRLAPLATPAALGLAGIMVGATTSVALTGGGSGALIPFVVGLLLAWVAAARR